MEAQAHDEQAHDEGKVNLQPYSTVHEFPVGTFIENIAVRRSGPLLLSIHNQNALVMLDPSNPHSQPVQVHVFEASVCGIVEMGEDVFFISSGTIGAEGSWSVYKVDLSRFVADSSGHVTTPAEIQKLVDVPEALFLNGSAALSFKDGIIAVADSLLGAIYGINVQTAEVRQWLQSKLLVKVTENAMIPGLNGIKLHRGHLYCSNTDARKLLRVGISESGEPTGEVEIFAKDLNADDFAFDVEGSAYLATHTFQSVVKLGSNGARERIVGGLDDTTAAGSTAVVFGRTSQDRTSIYVTTNGGLLVPVHGKPALARVLRVEVGHAETSDSHPS